MKKFVFLSCLLVACAPTEDRVETAQGGVRLCADGSRSYFGACPEDTHGYKPGSSPKVVLSPPAPERSRPPSGNRTDCNASRMPGSSRPPDCPPPTTQSTQLKDEEARLAEIKRQREELERTRVQAETEAEQAKLDAERERIAEIKRQQKAAKRLARAQAKTQVTSTSTLIHGRYQDHGDGTVTDVVNKLRWKRCAEGQTWTGTTCNGTAIEYTWNKLPTFSGGWRVPTIEEAKTLLYCRSTGRWGESLAVNRNSTWLNLSDSERYVCGKGIGGTSDNPDIDNDIFVNTPLLVWTSSEHVLNAEGVWVVGFRGGNVNGNNKNGYGAVRVVSSSQ